MRFIKKTNPNLVYCIFLRSKIFHHIAKITYQSCKNEILKKLEEKKEIKSLLAKEINQVEMKLDEGKKETLKEESKNQEKSDESKVDQDQKVSSNISDKSKEEEKNVEEKIVTEKASSSQISNNEEVLSKKFEENHKLIKVETILKTIHYLSATFEKAYIINQVKEEEVNI